jgi:hypothetical protein
LPRSETSSTTYVPLSMPVNANCPLAFATVVASIRPVSAFRSRSRAFGIGELSAFQAAPRIEVRRVPIAPVAAGRVAAALSRTSRGWV